jgi:hypothetical protein
VVDPEQHAAEHDEVQERLAQPAGQRAARRPWQARGLDGLVLPVADATWRDRLAAYWAARNRFVESGRDVRPSPRVTDMLAQVREPLLSVLRISPDFRPAYDPLLAMAAALARSDASGARTLLGELSRIQPARSEAIRLLAALAGEPPTVEPAAR